MIGIETVVVEIPERRIDVAAVADAVGFNKGKMSSITGFTQLAKKALNQEASDLCVAAAERLFAGHRSSRSKVECMVVVTQNPDGYGIPHVAAIVQAKLGLDAACASFDVGLGGSGYVYGLAIIKSLMEANQFRSGLLFTCDPYSRVVGDLDGAASLLFGDAATVTLLSDKPTWEIGRFDFGTDGGQGDALQVRLRLGGRLYMDAELVREFAISRGVRSLQAALSFNGLTLDQIDRIILQQGSRAIVEGIAQALDIQDKAAFYAEGYGDTVSSSVPIAFAQNASEADRRIALFGYGTGLSWAATVLTRVP